MEGKNDGFRLISFTFKHPPDIGGKLKLECFWIVSPFAMFFIGFKQLIIFEMLMAWVDFIAAF